MGRNAMEYRHFSAIRESKSLLFPKQRSVAQFWEMVALGALLALSAQTLWLKGFTIMGLKFKGYFHIYKKIQLRVHFKGRGSFAILN